VVQLLEGKLMIDEQPVHDVVRALDEFGRAQREIGAQLARSMDLPRAGLGILRYLKTSGSVTTGCAAQYLRVDLSVASRQVSALVAAGLVRRTVDDGDRRARTLELTEAGQAKVEAIRVAITELMAETFEAWDPEELKAAADQMSAIARTIAQHHRLASAQAKDMNQTKETV
jgi:DNA-binding MarR family transcriptional regulator